MHALLFFCSSLGEHLQKKMSSTKQYIQAETSSRIDACFGGVVVEHESHKFQYYQDRNKRWPFTCSEKGCELFVLEKRSKFSRSLIFSLRLLLSFSQLNVLPRTRGVVVSAFDWSEERRGMLARRALLCFLFFFCAFFHFKEKKIGSLPSRGVVWLVLKRQNMMTLCLY